MFLKMSSIKTLSILEWSKSSWAAIKFLNTSIWATVTSEQKVGKSLAKVWEVIAAFKPSSWKTMNSKSQFLISPRHSSETKLLSASRNLIFQSAKLAATISLVISWRCWRASTPPWRTSIWETIWLDINQVSKSKTRWRPTRASPKSTWSTTLSNSKCLKPLTSYANAILSLMNLT